MQVGIARVIDELGRVVLPSEYRDVLGFKKGDKVIIKVEGNKMVLQADSERCFLCGSEDNIKQIKHKYICSDCISEIKN